MIRILIVDDHTLFRESISRLLSQEEDFSVAGTCGTLQSAATLLRSIKADVLLLDFDLDGALGTELFEVWKREQPQMRVLMVTGGMSDHASRRAVREGIDGLLLKHSNPQQLVQAVRQVAAGDGWWDKTVVTALAGLPAETAAFTTRQRQVLDLLLNGLSNKELASALNVSESAVKASLQELFKKTGVRTRSQLVRFALELGPQH